MYIWRDNIDNEHARDWVQPWVAQDLTFCVCKYKDESEVESESIKVGGFRRGYDEKRRAHLGT